MNRIYNALFVLMLGGMTACTDNNDEWINSSDTVPIGLQVYTSDNTESRGISNDTYFPADKVIGVAATDVNGMTYGFGGYDNVPYKATGTGTSQTWAATGDAIMVSNIPAKIYAYYPYDSSVKDLSSITLPPYTQTDYMYAVPVIGITAENPSCSLTMQHAMAAVRVNLTKGTYIGTGEWNSTILSSNAIALQGTLNAFNGQLGNFSGVGGNLTMNSSNDYYLSSTPKNIDILAIPTGQSDKITVTVTVDGKQYTTQTSAVTLLQGKVYTVDLTLNEYELSVKAVTVKPWSEITQNSSSADFGYQLKVTGNMEGIAVNTQIQDGKAIITCVPSDPRRIIKHPTVDGATINITDDYETNNMVIEVTDLTKDATLTFDGLETGMIVAKYLVEDTINPVQIVTSQLTGWRLNSVTIGCEGSYHSATLKHTFSSTGEHIVRIRVGTNSQMLNMLFYGCGNLLEIDMYNYKGSPTILNKMFYGCGKLQKVDAEFLDTSQVGDANGVFCNCLKLEEIVGIEDWAMGKATTIQDLFAKCETLKQLDLSTWDVSNVKNMQGVFQGCNNIENIKMVNWNTENVTNMMQMFYGCGALTELDLSNFNTSNVTDMQQMLSGVCGVMTSLDVSSFDTSNVTNMKQMFAWNTNCTEIKFGTKWNTAKVTTMSEMFRDDKAITTIDVANWDVSKLESLYCTFRGCNALKTLDVSKWNTSALKNLDYTFDGCENLEALDVSGWKVPELTTMAGAFAVCKKITVLDLSGWEPTKLTSISVAFSHCSSIEELDFSGFKNTPLEGVERAFLVTHSLKKIIGIENLNVSKVGSFKQTFNQAGLVGTLDLSKWDMSSATDLSYMFGMAYSIENIIMPSCTTNNVTNMANMFEYTVGLNKVDMKGFNLSKVTNMSNMFITNNTVLTYIRMTGPINANVNVTGMFNGRNRAGNFVYSTGDDFSKIISALPSTWTATAE